MVKASASVTVAPLAAVAVALVVVAGAVDVPAVAPVTSAALPLTVRLTLSPAMAPLQLLDKVTAAVLRVLA
ncbi:hypothetical protein D3C87_1194620 [compost metagenome]